MGNKNLADNFENISGINLQYRDQKWVLRGKRTEWRLLPVHKMGPDTDHPGEYRADSTNAKHYNRLNHMLPALRKRAITPIMRKENRETMQELLNEIQRFHDWCKEKFKIKLDEE